MFHHWLDEQEQEEVCIIGTASFDCTTLNKADEQPTDPNSSVLHLTDKAKTHHHSFKRSSCSQLIFQSSNSLFLFCFVEQPSVKSM